MIIDFTGLSSKEIYHIMTQSIIPRPIAWVLSANENKSYNLAPFSYFTAVSSAPPILMFSVGKKADGSYKDTRVNIEKRKEFTLHIASEQLAKEVTQTSKSLDYNASELDLVNLNLVDFDNFSLPRISECPIAFACTLFEIQEMGKVPQSLIFGEIQQVYIANYACSQDQKNRIKINANAISPLARLGGTEYSCLSRIFSIPRPD